MKVLADLSELDLALRDAAHSITSYTNFFPDREQYKILIAEQKVSILSIDKTLWILSKDRGFDHLYYSAPDKASFLEGFGRISEHINTSVTITLIGKEQKLLADSQDIIDLGFQEYSTFNRMQRLYSNLDNFKDLLVPVEYAVLNDVNEIEELFLYIFDVYDDEIPSNKEIEEYIKNKSVTVIRSEGKIAGCLINTKKGKTSLFQYIAVDERHRGKKIASSLIKNYIAESSIAGSIRSLLWVRATNNVAISFHKHFDFIDEGLRKAVFLKRSYSG